MPSFARLALFLFGLAAGLESPSAHLERERTIVVTSRPPYYTPAILHVAVGEVVHWINPLPAERHGVREVEQATFSFELSPGGEQVVRFTRPGEYVYRCRFHPWMAGRIVVEEASRKPADALMKTGALKQAAEAAEDPSPQGKRNGRRGDQETLWSAVDVGSTAY